MSRPTAGPGAAHREYELRIARALRAPDAIAALRVERADPSLSPVVADMLAAVDERGFQLGALLVAKLRFERILRGSRAAEAWFDAAPAEFSHRFAAYHAAVPPTAVFPDAEVDTFETFLGGAFRPPRPPRPLRPPRPPRPPTARKKRSEPAS